MKSVVYWDSDELRVRKVLEALSGSVAVKCVASLYELRSPSEGCSPAAVIIGLPGQAEGRLTAGIGQFASSSSLPIFVLTQASAPVSVTLPSVHCFRVPEQLTELVAAVRATPDATPTTTLSSESIFVGESATMRQVDALIRKYAEAPHPVLILGETGTGKELAAKALHSLSSRKKKELVALNCSALPETLIESELFGAEKGAFTDAVTRKGAVARASESTLFLDEIGSMSQAAQPRLLRVVETGEYWPLGAEKPQKSNFRLVSASCRNPVDLAEKGQFRQDLLFRISDLIIVIPALRERREDIPTLTKHFCLAASRGRCEISGQALEKLMAYSWPGNVRELKSVVTRACVNIQSGAIGADDISFISDLHGILRS